MCGRGSFLTEAIGIGSGGRRSFGWNEMAYLETVPSMLLFGI
jgi:hypothetical protein